MEADLVSAPSGLDQQKYQQIYTQYQTGVNQLKVIDTQVNQILAAIDELSRNLLTVQGLKNYPDDSEIVVPLGTSILLKSKLQGKNEILLNMGSDIYKPSTYEEAISALEERATEMRSILEKANSDKQNLENLVVNLENQLNQMQQGS